MANLYLRSTDGSNVDNGSTWALAKATLAGIASVDAAGDVINVSQAHAESAASGGTLTFDGTLASPTRIIGANDAAEPPTAVSVAPTVTRTGTVSLLIQGCIYCYGLTWNVGSGTSTGAITFSIGPMQVFESNVFQIPTTGATGRLIIGTQNFVVWQSCSIKFSNVAHAIRMDDGARLHWHGGAIVSGSSSPTVLLIYTNGTAGLSASVLVENVDLSNFGTGFNVSDPPPNGSLIVLRNVKLPGSWAGAVLNSAITEPSRVEMWNADSGNTTYRLWVEDYAGQIKDETTRVRSGGASVNGTSVSWKHVSSTRASLAVGALISPELVINNTVVGSSVTLTVEFLHDNAIAATDADLRLDVDYMGASGSPLGSFSSNGIANKLPATSTTNHASSAASWTTTGMSNPNAQKLVVTFTPQQPGYFRARVAVSKASATYYIDPKITAS